MSTQQNFLDKLWQDEDGHQALVAAPNLPLIGWALFMVIGWFLPDGRLGTTAQFISSSFLFVWAALEIYSGKSYLRRLLGLVVVIYIVVSQIS